MFYYLESIKNDKICEKLNLDFNEHRYYIYRILPKLDMTINNYFLQNCTF